VLGFSLVSNLSKTKSRGFKHVAYWRRSIYAATAARTVAARVGVVQQEEAFLAAQMVEETAKTYVLARSIGPVSPLPPAEVARWYNRFRRHYGQPSRRRPRPSAGWTFEAHGVDLKGTWVPHRS